MILHYRALQFYVSQGLVLTKIHRVLKFSQSNWLAPFINLNIEQRKLATNNFDVSLYKLFNNATFGKFAENQRKRINIDILTDPKKAEKQLSKPTLAGFTILNKNLVILKRFYRNLKLNKPIIIGNTILHLAKIKIYDFHYNTIYKLFNPSICKLMFTDTDSFLYWIKVENLYKELAKISDQLDTSDYPITHPLYSSKNRKVLGKFKDELSSNIMTEFVGLKPKLYSFLVEEGAETKRAKGVKKSVIERELRFHHYKKTLKTQKDLYVTQNLIQSKNHTIYSLKQRKLALSCYDDKRYLVNNYLSLPYGHRDIPLKQMD